MRPSITAMVAGTAPAARDLGLDGARGREVLGMRHAVGDDRRFERDERPAGGDGLGDGGREGERWGHGTSQVMWRAAARKGGAERGLGVEAVGAGGEMGGDEGVAGTGEADGGDRRGRQGDAARAAGRRWPGRRRR